MAMDYAQPATVEATLLERLLAAHISEDRARALIVGGGVRVAGRDEPECNPEASVPRPVSWHFPAS